MKNAILSILTKISKMDAETKELTAQIEAQSLLLSALMLTVSRNGGIEELTASISKAINSLLDSQEDIIKSDAEILLTKFQEQLNLIQIIDGESEELPEISAGALAQEPDSGAK